MAKINVNKIKAAITNAVGGKTAILTRIMSITEDSILIPTPSGQKRILKADILNLDAVLTGSEILKTIVLNNSGHNSIIMDITQSPCPDTIVIGTISNSTSNTFSLQII